MILGFLAIEREGHIDAVTLSERGRRGCYQGYAFVGRSEQHVERDVGGDDGIAVGAPHRGNRRARAEQPGIEEIRALAS
jgi:hypothetical protein